MQKQPPEVFYEKRCSEKFHKNSGLQQNIKKETLAHVFSCEFCEISKNTFFTEHLRVTRSLLKALIETALLVFAKKINPYSKRNENLISFSGRLSLLECLG